MHRLRPMLCLQPIRTPKIFGTLPAGEPGLCWSTPIWWPRRTSPSAFTIFLIPRWPAERVGIAYPLFGTTATHAAALYALWGEEKGRAFFKRLQQRGLLVVDGNSVVRDMVADGRLMWGLTDTDDAIGAVKKGQPVKIILPDQGQDDMGTLVIPYTVALVAGGPHPQKGKKLIDFLIGKEAETMLANSGFCQIRTYATG